MGLFQDISPVTIEGKVFSVILILLGMILFGTLISTITDYFIADEEISQDIGKLSEKLDQINNRLYEIETFKNKHWSRGEKIRSGKFYLGENWRKIS